MARNVLISIVLAVLPGVVGCQHDQATDQPAAPEMMGVTPNLPGKTLPGTEPVVLLDENKKAGKPPPGGTEAVVLLDESKKAGKPPHGGNEPVVQLDENKKGSTSAKGAPPTLPVPAGINNKSPGAPGSPVAPTLPPPKDINK
jgi:hypothetical protein